jgi:hypothetical protein
VKKHEQEITQLNQNHQIEKQSLIEDHQKQKQEAAEHLRSEVARLEEEKMAERSTTKNRMEMLETLNAALKSGTKSLEDQIRNMKNSISELKSTAVNNQKSIAPMLTLLTQTISKAIAKQSKKLLRNRELTGF